MVSHKRAGGLPERILTATVPWARLRPEEFSHPPCALCGSFVFETQASLVINWSEFFLVRCERCGLLWRTPMPDGEFLTNLYADPYFDPAKHAPALRDQVGIADADAADKLRRTEITKKELERWRRRGVTPLDEQGQTRRLLEIGGGRGYLQRAAQEVGFDTLGLEISTHGIRAAIEQRLAIIPVTLDELCDRYAPYPAYFDVVVFFDFLEHVVDPGRILRMVRFVLKDDGVAILRVPCIADGELPRYHLIDHIFHFSERTMQLLLQREDFTFEAQHSGRFPGDEGQVQNVTYFCRKLPGEGPMPSTHKKGGV